MPSTKFVVLGDLHLGARNASLVVANHQLSFFEKELFPYMEKHKITTILQLGDLFDTRKFSSHIVLHLWKTRFFDVMESRGYTFHTLIGNHDIPMRNSIVVNSQRILLGSYKCVNVLDVTQELDLLGTSWLIVPWICDENHDEVHKLVASTEAVYCAGHFEFAGFEMQRGITGSGGESADAFKEFDAVLSGHYHTRSTKGNVLYTGIPYELTWADFNDQKGFHVFDSKNHKLTYVETKATLFVRLEYDDKKVTPSCPTDLKGKYVKVIVVNKTDPYQFDKYITNILSQEVIDLKISDLLDDVTDDIDVDGLALDDTKTLITAYVTQVETELDKTKIKNMLHGLYLQALEVTS